MENEFEMDQVDNDPNQFLDAYDEAEDQDQETNVGEERETNVDEERETNVDEERLDDMDHTFAERKKEKKERKNDKNLNIKKEILKKMGYDVQKKYGPMSSKFLDSLKVTSTKGKKPTGLSLNGVKIIVVDQKTGNYRLSLNATKGVTEFNHDIAVCEHERQLVITKQNQVVLAQGGTSEGGQAVFVEVNDVIQNEIDLESDLWLADGVGVVSEEYLRDFNGIRVSSNVDGLRVEVETWKERSDATEDPILKDLYSRAVDQAKRRIEQLGMERGDLYNENFFETHENVTLKFEKFKKWALRNLGALSAVGITIAGIVVTIVLAGKKVIITGAKGTAKLASAVANVGKFLAKGLGVLGPAVAAVFGFLATVLGWGASGLVFLTNNLWLVAVALVGLFYSTKKVWKKIGK